MEAVGYLYDIRLANYMAQRFCYRLLIHKILTANSYIATIVATLLTLNPFMYNRTFCTISSYPAIPQQYVLYPAAI